MTSPRPRLLAPLGSLPDDPGQDAALRSAFEVVEVGSLAEARRLAALGGGNIVLSREADAMPGDAAPSPRHLGAILEHIAEGVGVIDASGGLAWANARLRDEPEAVRERFTSSCRRAIDEYNQEGERQVPLAARPGRKFAFRVGEQEFEAMVSIAEVDEAHAQRVVALVGVLWEVTDSRRLQRKLDAIDAAGANLLRFDARTITELNMAERLKMLEERIVLAARELLRFDNFEVRLIDRESNRLELVFAVGISPLKIGEVLHAEADGNGISGYVAATGRSYVCADVPGDERYCEGLTDAASSLTVPLRLHDLVIGVFNVESSVPGAFDDRDRLFAEIFGRYVAMAMHILDLLVIERYTTNEQVSESLLSELALPLERIVAEAQGLHEHSGDAATRDGLARILDTTTRLRDRLEQCAKGPKSLIGAEQECRRSEPDPRLRGKRVIIADNEPVVLEAISDFLRQKGCDVTSCCGGIETIDRLRAATGDHEAFDLVISDIRMPDRNGYEVFREAKTICAELPVILMTGFGYDRHHSIVRASAEGLHSFLFKPLRANQLLEAVTSAVG